MGGILQPGTTIHGVVASPGIPLVDSPSGGFYETPNSGLGFSLSGIENFKFENPLFTIGKKTSSTFAFALGADVAAVGQPMQLAVNPSQNLLVVCEPVNNRVGVYSRNITTGILTFLNYTASGGLTPRYVTFSPDGRHLIIQNGTDLTLSVYSVNSTTGVMTAIVGSPFAIPPSPGEVIVSPNGLFVYVKTGGGVAAFSRNVSTGFLTPIAGVLTPTLSTSHGMAITANGKYLFTAATLPNNNGKVSAYSCSLTTGILTEVVGSPFACGFSTDTTILDIALSPDDAFLYFPNNSENTISVFSISSGILTPIASSPFAVSPVPGGMCVSPDGLHFYVCSMTSSSLQVFSRNTATGAISGPSTVGVGAFPHFILALASGDISVYVSNQNSDIITTGKTSATPTYNLVEAYYDPFNSVNGIFNINGQLQQLGAPLLTQTTTDARYAQLTGQYVGTATGTGDAIVLTPAVPLVSYATAIGETLLFKASANNTVSPPTIAISGLAALNTTMGSVALPIGGIIAGNVYYAFVESATSIRVAPFDAASVNGDTFNNPITIPPATAAAHAMRAGQYGSQINGWIYQNSGSDIAIDAGSGLDATRAYFLTGAALTKTSGAWAAGTAAGGLDTGTIGNNDYYIWAIARSDTGVVDYLFSLSSTAPTMPANYAYKRLIGWFKRVGGVNVAFHTYETEGGGIEFSWDAPTLDVNLSNTLTTSRRTDAVKVPLNFSVIAILSIGISDTTSASRNWVTCPDHTDAAPSDPSTGNINSIITVTVGTRVELRVRTSSAGLIAARSDLAIVDIYQVSTYGFTWARRV